MPSLIQGLAETYVLFQVTMLLRLPTACLWRKRRLCGRWRLTIRWQKHTPRLDFIFPLEWDRDGSEKEYRSAIELKPNYATAHHWFGADLANAKRFDDGLLELRRAEELDRFLPIIGTNLGDTLVFARRYDEAIAQYKRTLIRNPNFAYAHRALGRAYGSKKMYPEAIAETRTALVLDKASSTKGYLGLWLAQIREARSITAPRFKTGSDP